MRKIIATLIIAFIFNKVFYFTTKCLKHFAIQLIKRIIT